MFEKLLIALILEMRTVNLKKESELKLHLLFNNMKTQNGPDAKVWNLYLLTVHFRMFGHGCIK